MPDSSRGAFFGPTQSTLLEVKERQHAPLHPNASAETLKNHKVTWYLQIVCLVACYNTFNH
jgi:hypothetical protein